MLQGWGGEGCIHRHQHVMRVFGTQATFIHDDGGARLHQNRDPALTANPVTLATLPSSKGDLIPAFIEAISNDTDFNGHAQTILDVISICAACEQSLKSKAEVEVNYV